MFSFGEDVGLIELVECYVETQRPQPHPRITEHLGQLRASFESALETAIPEKPEPPHEAIWMLFFGMTRALAAERAPLDGVLESGLLFVQLERIGQRDVAHQLTRLAEQRARLRAEQVALAARLLSALTGTAQKTRVSIEALRATGIYPGRTPADFDLFDHL